MTFYTSKFSYRNNHYVIGITIVMDCMLMSLDMVYRLPEDGGVLLKRGGK
jgi:hypothetical protein